MIFCDVIFHNFTFCVPNKQEHLSAAISGLCVLGAALILDDLYVHSAEYYYVSERAKARLPNGSAEHGPIHREKKDIAERQSLI